MLHCTGGFVAASQDHALTEDDQLYDCGFYLRWVAKLKEGAMGGASCEIAPIKMAVVDRGRMGFGCSGGGVAVRQERIMRFYGQR